jgi:hypothetical protein
MLRIDLWRGVKTIGTSPGEGGTARALSIREPRNEAILLRLCSVEDLR